MSEPAADGAASGDALRRTALRNWHATHGARMVPFGGWDMPVQYATGVLTEHHAVRNAVGLFDIGHMGQIAVDGSHALAWLQWLVPTDVSRLEIGQAQYSVLCAPDGGAIDDIIIYRLGAVRYLAIVNAANTDIDLTWLNHCLAEPGPGIDTHHVNLHHADARTLIAIQGPKSLNVLQKVADTELSGLGYYRAAEAMIAGVEALVARTGYTGERGYEIAFDASHAVTVWEALLDAGSDDGIIPCGLGARDTLRLEAGMALYGHELTRDVNPFEANLERIVRLDKPQFVGRDALAHVAQTGRARALVGLELTVAGVPRAGYPILDTNGAPIGETTSGGPSPTLKKSIAMGFVPASHSAVGTELAVEIRGRAHAAVVVPLPFYKRPVVRRAAHDS
jgi:aminomethyltransferase